jgi:uncharacterized protein YraI
MKSKNKGYNRNMKKRIILILAVFLPAAGGCSTPENSQETAQQDAAALIFTAAALTAESGDLTPSTSTPLPEPTENLPALTNTPAYLIQVPVTLNGLNLRGGPGLLYPSLGTFAEGTPVLTLGMVPDGSWIKVRAPLSGGGSVDGWMFAEFLDLSALNTALPVEDIPANNTIRGSVTDLGGNPIRSVRVAAFIQTDSGEQRDEATTNQAGEFFIYLPTDPAESARLEIVAVNCSSNISEILPGGSCLVADYFPVNWRQTIALPQQEPISFTYEEGIVFLEGKVVYQDGNGASEILIKATRQSDEVESEQVTPVGGAFRLPLGPGTWEVVAVRFQQDGTALLGETRIFEIEDARTELEPLIIPYIEIIQR